MTSLHVIENKIAYVKKYVALLRSYKERTIEDLQNDATLRGAIERYLYLAAQASIDLAEATIAYRGYRKPTTYREDFEILIENSVIGNALGEKLIKMVAFRNRLAHAYDSIDYGVIVSTLNNSLVDLDDFVAAIEIEI